MHYYETQKAGWLKQSLWRIAGADKYILERATYSDQVKYMCLGGIILSTGVMAGLAGGYAFYTVFEPRGSAIESEFSLTTLIISFIFGFLWGLMIFNLDRFIVSSTGKGDGTEVITWEEFKGAIPRLILAVIIAITISKPLEIRMFKSEIDVELHAAQMEKQKQYLGGIEAIYEERIENEKKKIAKWENEIQIKEKRYVELENLLADEMGGSRGPRGYGPEAKKLEEQLKRMDYEIKLLKEKYDPLIKESYDNIKKFENQKQKDIEKAGIISAGLDGLLERIKLAHKIAGPVISLFITLLFIAIETLPIFFKLMLVKTPYDFLKENIEELIKAEHGIHIEYNYHKDKKGQERDLVIYLQKEKLMVEKKRLQEVQKELIEYAIEKYKENMMKKINENPEDFIKIQENTNGQSYEA